MNPDLLLHFRDAASRFLACRERLETFKGGVVPEGPAKSLREAATTLVHVLKTMRKEQPDIQMYLFRGFFFRLDHNENGQTIGVTATPEKAVARISEFSD